MSVKIFSFSIKYHKEPISNAFNDFTIISIYVPSKEQQMSYFNKKRDQAGTVLFAFCSKSVIEKNI